MSMQLGFLNAARINALMNGLQDPRLLPAPLTWNTRIPDVPAADEEIMARFIGTLQIADLIADDAEAVVYSQGKFQYETQKVPNLKMGIAMNQARLTELMRIQSNIGSADDIGLFTNWENQTMINCRYGVELRTEVLKLAMLLDSFNYDRLGIKVTNGTWGMFSDLKVTPSTGWDNVAATPITDIQTLRRIARVRYGQNFNRITMSTSALQYAVATTEFINQARAFNWGFGGLPAPVIPLQSDSMLKDMFQRILSGTDNAITIEIDDRRYWSQGLDGLIQSYELHPINKVLLTNTANDNNPMVMDFANGIVTESVVANLAQMNLVGSMPVGRGPMAYGTANPDLNPPNITYWGVKRGFPRKHMLQASAVLTVGTFANTIAVGVPFPA